MSGPIGSEYPGTPVMLVMAGLTTFILAKAGLAAYRRRGDVTGRQNWEAHALLAVIAAVFLVMELWAVWTRNTAR
jgi:hypothetical protein